MNQEEQQRQLWDIVMMLADDDPYAYNDNSGRMECIFCNDAWGWSSYDKHTKDHEPDCLITKARVLVQQAQPIEQPVEPNDVSESNPA